MSLPMLMAWAGCLLPAGSFPVRRFMAAESALLGTKGQSSFTQETPWEGVHGVCIFRRLLTFK